MGSKLSTRNSKETFKEQLTKICLLKDYANFFHRKDTCGNFSKDHLNATKEQSIIQFIIDCDENEVPVIGDHETQESEGGEVDLHRYLVGCKKNPGHRQFIPVDTFTLKHLPEGLQNNDLYEYIKATADLTVRVDVKMTSLHRPKFYSRTTHPYPFYNMSDTKNLRTGTGRVKYVNKFEVGVTQNGDIGLTDHTKCWCRKCHNSDSPSNIWWEFRVYTATHVVFDEIEASHTTLRFFYDREDSPMICVDKVTVRDVTIEYDICQLKCVTCNNNLGNKLMFIWDHYESIRWKVCKNYKDSRFKHKFNFIVSHPHGCSKQVSVGQWKDKVENGGRTKFTYTTSTCPGSSGV
ncbi:hypothetical protein BgiMline_022226 [Biomphalaria glabrata]|nr:hypothetical protein BgiMline_010111 [Biomphalaria glabrata]